MRARYRSTCKFGCDPRRRSPPTSGDRHHALAPRKYTSHAARIHSTRDCSDTEMRQYRAYQSLSTWLIALSLHTPSDHSHSHTKEHTISCNNKVHNIYRTVRPFHPISLSLSYLPFPFVQPYTISPFAPRRGSSSGWFHAVECDTPIVMYNVLKL